jgi:very-short-patch-repair endonuclease
MFVTALPTTRCLSTDWRHWVATAPTAAHDAVMHPLLVGVLRDQHGVVARDQALRAGLTSADVRRLCARRELVALHRGVYVDHTGPPTWSQHAWAAILLCWPAALAGQSALRAAEGPGSPREEHPIHVAIDHDRRLSSPAGVVVHRSRHLEERVQWNLSPPRQRYHDAVLDAAARAGTELLALSELARALQTQRTSAKRLRQALAERERTPRGRWLAAVLDDIAAGACSVLEHAYLRDVERAHGLSPARRQVRDRIGAQVVYRDAEYVGGLVLELDGRVHHSSVQARDQDMDRDLLTALAGKDTVRVGWGQVYERPCWTAACIARLLALRGWTGSPRRCGPRCRLEWPMAA